jgi:hypothetical protein
MADNKPKNPFEEHIESDAFDVSKLEHTSQQGDISEAGRRVQELLDSLPQPLSHELWDTHLDDDQKRLSAHLSMTVVERVLRQNHADELADLSDDQLTFLITVPIVLAMLTEERLHRTHQPPPTPARRPAATALHPLEENDPSSTAEDTLNNLGERLRLAGQRIKEILVRLYERFTS